jgi:hypothetical protein
VTYVIEQSQNCVQLYYQSDPKSAPSAGVLENFHQYSYLKLDLHETKPSFIVLARIRLSNSTITFTLDYTDSPFD